MSLSITSINGQKVRFGTGLRNDICTELSGLDAQKALVLSTPQQVDMAMELATAIGDRAAGVFTRAAMHTPVDVTNEAVEHAQSVQADSIVSIGGGSTIGLGKAIALRTGLPQIAIPTTYAGSEATPILGQTEGGEKTTLTDAKVLPRVILYDPELVASLPPAMTVNSALNAMAHAAEALYAKDRTEQTTELALDGLRAFADGLPKVIAEPGDLNARQETHRGAWACGTVLGLVGMALHHKLCHVLGGSFNLPHAETHAIVLPHAIAYNAAGVPDVLAPVSQLLGGGEPGQALWDFARKTGAPTALKDLGLTETDLDRATEIALRNPYWNPQPVTAEGLRGLLQNAWAGNAPSA
ncbi:MAG: iron-containing alcohol dehydrogenase [Rhodobacteraceae bacterium]|nr:iron-containing alcohol dehydrogenase [Paracoccaceae bacterium]